MMTRGRNRGFKLGRKLIRVFKWITRKRVKSCKYVKFEGQKTRIIRKNQAISKIFNWGKTIRRGLFNPNSNNRGFIRVGNEPVVENTKPVQVPKGHVAVYVGEREGDTRRRVLVPVFFLNHPLFGKLLKEAEEVYGFENPGRITIPCPLSEFENVRTRIAAGGKFRPWIHLHRQSYITGLTAC